MGFSLWLALVGVIGVAIFAFQNSTAPPVVTKFLFWKFETSLIYTILISIGSGMLIILLLWISRIIQALFHGNHLKQERTMKNELLKNV